jgi:hypothetical protein
MQILTKELFCNAIQSIQNEMARIAKAEDALSETLLEGHVIVKESETTQTLIDLLIALTGDEESMIEWWLFEKVDKYLYNDEGKVVRDLTDAGELYDYLVEFGKS